MDLLFTIAPLFGLILLANALVAGRTGYRFFDGFIFLTHLVTLVAGVATAVVPPELAATLPVNLRLLTLPLLFLGLWGMVVSLPPLRRFLTRWLPLDPASPVHTLALVFAGYLISYAILVLQGGLEALSESAAATPVYAVVLQQLFFILLALAGIGLFIRRDWREAGQRLGLVWPTASQLWGGVGWIVLLVILQGIAGAAWQFLEPEKADLLESINTALLSDIDTVGEWFLLAISAGLGEEILFRGALQPVFGIWFTAALFAVPHVQYGFTPITAVIFVIGVLLGYLRRRQNTSTAIFVHFGYNFILGLLSLLAPYLESIAGGS